MLPFRIILAKTFPGSGSNGLDDLTVYLGFRTDTSPFPKLYRLPCPPVNLNIAVGSDQFALILRRVSSTSFWRTLYSLAVSCFITFAPVGSVLFAAFATTLPLLFAAFPSNFSTSHTVMYPFMSIHLLSYGDLDHSA